MRTPKLLAQKFGASYEHWDEENCHLPIRILQACRSERMVGPNIIVSIGFPVFVNADTALPDQLLLIPFDCEMA